MSPTIKHVKNIIKMIASPIDLERNPHVGGHVKKPRDGTIPHAQSTTLSILAKQYQPITQITKHANDIKRNKTHQGRFKLPPTKAASTCLII